MRLPLIGERCIQSVCDQNRLRPTQRASSLEAVIASLKGAGADQGAIDAATAQLESVVSNLSATQAQADAEQPAV
jgi:hypothetical protein